MAKTSSKDSIIVVGGYLLSADMEGYSVEAKQAMLDCTGFTDGWQNYVGGLYQGKMTLNALWDHSANTVTAALLALGAKAVTVIPNGYTLGNLAFSMSSQQENFQPGGAMSGLLKAGALNFFTSGAQGGPHAGWALQHGAITNTLTGTGFVDPTGTTVTASCGGFLHVYTPCAADTYVVKIQHCATIDGAYADLVTFTLNGSARASEQVQVASGTIQPYRRVLATRTGSAGNSFGFTCVFYHNG